ncbi:MAG: cytochrome P450 [Cyanobacteria bacterium P01_C01_bin.38]
MNSLNTTESQKQGCPFHNQSWQKEKVADKYQPFSDSQLSNPYSFYEEARSKEPIFYSFELDGYVVTSYQDIITILKDPVTYSSKDNLQPIGEYSKETIDVLRTGFPFVSDLVNSDGSRHKFLKEPLLKVFAPARIKEMEGSVCKTANRLVNSFIKDGSTDILEQFAFPMPLEVILNLYGVPLEKMSDIKVYCNDMAELFSSPLTPVRQVECARSFVSLQYMVADLIEQRQKLPQDDLISNIQDSDLTMPDMVMVLCGLIFAGHKTTSHLIGNALKILLEKPELWQAIRENPSIIPGVVEEALRYDAPVPTVNRTTTGTVDLGGLILPKGTKLFLMYASANRDETKYENAENFDIKRFQQKNTPHLAFGYGMHRCIGSRLALTEARIALQILSARLPNLRLQPNQEFTYIPTLRSRGCSNLFVEWDV